MLIVRRKRLSTITVTKYNPNTCHGKTIQQIKRAAKAQKYTIFFLTA
jgi:hypothetical protein